MDLVKHVAKCFEKANKSETRLSKDVLGLEGMSGHKTRILYNELCALVRDGRPTQYLEVGTWKGSTLCSAMYQNPQCHGTVIENWAQFGGPKTEFEKNVDKFDFKNRLTVFETDIFSFDFTKLEHPIDIYVYDGAHDAMSQYKGITQVWDALATQAIIVIDDWNLYHVRRGTLNALRDVEANILKCFEITYTTDGHSHTPVSIASQEFWNGIGVFVISK